MPENLTVAQLSQVISQVTAPAFLLGSVATYTSVLIARMNRIVDRSHVLKAILGEPLQEEPAIGCKPRPGSKAVAAVDGLGMLLHQAVPGFERWFGVTPECMRALGLMWRRLPGP